MAARGTRFADTTHDEGIKMIRASELQLPFRVADAALRIRRGTDGQSFRVIRITYEEISREQEMIIHRKIGVVRKVRAAFGNSKNGRASGLRGCELQKIPDLSEN